MPSATAASRIAIAWTGASCASDRRMLLLPGVQLFQGLPRREPLEVELLQLGEHRMLKRQAELGTGLRSLERPLTLQFPKHASRAHDHLPGQASQLCDVDPVAAVGATCHHLVQEDDTLT